MSARLQVQLACLAASTATDSQRLSLGAESVNIVTDTALTPPATANHAEIHVFGGIIWTTMGSPPDETTEVGHRSSDGAHIELESTDEINNFLGTQLIDVASASIYVEYFFLKTHIE